MFVSALNTLFLFGLAATAHPTLPSLLKSRQSTLAGECPTTGVHVIAVSGAGNVPVDQYGLLGNLSTSIVNAIPGSTTVQVPYDKAAANQLQATTAGAVNFMTYVNDFHASCPCSKVVIIGYSSGAIISMNSLCGASSPWISPALGLDSSYRDFIVGIVVYGDETHTASAPYNLGTCTGNGRFPRAAANAACPVFADRIRSYCDVADPQCCLGTDNNAHFLYDQEYDGASTQFLVNQAASFGDICSSTVSSAPSSTAIPDPLSTSKPSVSSTTSLDTSSMASVNIPLSTVSSTSPLSTISSTSASTSIPIITQISPMPISTLSSIISTPTSSTFTSTSASLLPSSTSNTITSPDKSLQSSQSPSTPPSSLFTTLTSAATSTALTSVTAPQAQSPSPLSTSIAPSAYHTKVAHVPSSSAYHSSRPWSIVLAMPLCLVVGLAALI